MSSEETILRLRRNLSRNYDIRVMYIGEPVLGLRVPRTSVSDISKGDTDKLYDLLDSNIDQLRPGEIGTVYFIADSDHLKVEPSRFFKPFLEGTDAYDPATFGIKAPLSEDPEITPAYDLSRNELLPIDAVPEAAIENEFASVAESNSPTVDSSSVTLAVSDSDMMRIEEKPASQIDETSLSDEKLILSVEEPDSSDVFSQTAPGSNTGAVVELIPREYELDDNFFDQEENFPDDMSGKLLKDKQDDRVVGKILNDFARNSQKKRLASGRLKSGRRAEVLTKGKRGRYVRYRMPGEKITDIAIAPTVRAAAFHAKDGKIEIKKSDIREKVRRRRISSLINIVFDTSGSMDDHKKIRITTDVVIALLKDAYQKRDRVSLVTYCGRSAEIALPFTSSVEAAKRYLEKVPFGGTTPMASGMLTGLDTLLRELKKEPSAVPIMVLVTDGTANCSLNLGGNIRREIMQVCRQLSLHHINVLVIDISENGSKLSRDVAMQSNGSYYHPRSLSKEDIYSAICDERNSKTSFVAV
ncbi:VWA domain-containing protein [Methanolobus sp. ZRKC2]|uniref:VWA domain-containing protein n=1 Tax=Methanolobus sp. ZRKC2 TaxID=3125783 RepID=UPI00324F26AB